jgi:nitroreductase
MPAMEVPIAIAARRTIHDYRVEPLPEGALRRALAVATNAPNHRMTEPWRFVQAGPEARAKLLQISAELKRLDPATPAGQSALQKLSAKMLWPAELVVVCQVKHDDEDVAHEDYAAVACATYAAMLALWSEGIGSKWSTGDVTTDPRTYELLGIDPAQQSIVGFMWVGYAATETPKPRRRRSIDEVLRVVP